VSKLAPGANFKFVSINIRAAYKFANQTIHKHRIVHPNHIPAETIGNENIPAPIAPLATNTIPLSDDVEFSLFFIN
jgi:hypothetical protein